MKKHNEHKKIRKLRYRLINFKYLLFLFLIYLTTFTYQSCTKIDTTDSNLSAKETSTKFFAIPIGTLPIVEKIVKQLENENSIKEFASSFAVTNGYAIWNKVEIHIVPNNSSSFAAKASSANDTLVIVPLVLNNTNKVNGFLYSKVNQTANVFFFLRSDYSFFPFGKLKDINYNAEKFQLEIMSLDKLVFGHTKFTVLDNKLFRNINNQFVDTINQYVQISLPDYVTSFTPSITTPAACIPTCQTIFCRSGNSFSSAPPPSSSSYITFPCHFTYCDETFCWEPIPVPDPMPGGGGSGPAGGTGPHGGGAPGGGGTTPDPPIPPYISPCKVIDSLLANTTYSQYFQYLYDSIGSNREKGLALFDPFLATSNAVLVNGEPGKLKINQTLAIPADGFIHTHYIDPKALSVFSSDDFQSMYNWYSAGKMKNITTFTMAVITQNTSYIIMIEDPDKFQVFGNNFMGNIDDMLYTGYGIHEDSSATANEKHMLQGLQTLNAGLKVFKGNSNFTNFSPIKYSSTTNSVEYGPCLTTAPPQQ
jgi:hypothetical protein